MDMSANFRRTSKSACVVDVLMTQIYFCKASLFYFIFIFFMKENIISPQFPLGELCVQLVMPGSSVS